MARYLPVLHDMDESRELIAKARALVEADPGAEFVLLVPAHRVPLLDALLEPLCSPVRFAGRRAQRVRNQLLKAGLRLVATRLGNFDPVRAGRGRAQVLPYDAVVVATQPRRLLHILHRDLPCPLAQRFPSVRVVHLLDPQVHATANSILLPDTASTSSEQ